MLRKKNIFPIKAGKVPTMEVCFLGNTYKSQTLLLKVSFQKGETGEQGLQRQIPSVNQQVFIDSYISSEYIQWQVKQCQNNIGLKR